MPTSKELLALTTLFLQVLARPAPAGDLGSPNGDLAGDLELLYSQAFDYQPTQGTKHSNDEHGNEPCPSCGGDGGHGGGGHESGWPGPTVTGDCPPAPTSTVTITTDADGNGFGTITITDTVTDTISRCTATTTTNGLAPNTVTETETDTLTSTISSCTATTTDYETVTADASTITQTVTTPGPTKTETSTVTEAAETVTLPGSTETETETETATDTITQTTTLTHNQIITSTATQTETETLEVTKTVTSDDCGETGGGDGGGLDYGTCTDPTIKWEYGLDGRTEYSYTTNNQKDFPFGSSPTIGSPEDLICNRLRSPCNAPQETIDKCYEAEEATANLTGQEAADVWNELMT
ncbi:hypothetical protein N7450_009202 [Penicillium hetheringtonii]|uniref:Uncharacterized protein n=1 Tax=Penicillium hetheringtonii TaxID=911720 RepID=A0AAD6DGA3_9EURO|nr:hypothetical protein N7450_009202 [Penicillium hetheringtonii]